MFVFIYIYVDVSYISRSWVVVSLFFNDHPENGRDESGRAYFSNAFKPPIYLNMGVISTT